MQGRRRGETILNDIRREDLSFKTNKKMKNETVDLRSQRDYTLQQVVFEVFSVHNSYVNGAKSNYIFKLLHTSYFPDCGVGCKDSERLDALFYHII